MKTEEIENILNLISQGEWIADDSSIRTAINTSSGKHIAIVNCSRSIDSSKDISHFEHEANVRLITNASSIIKELLEDRLKLAVLLEKIQK